MHKAEAQMSGKLDDNVIRIITIERECGCGAAGIAEKVSARLHWKLWDASLTQEIARLAHCQPSAVEHQIIFSAHFGNSIDREADKLIEGNCGVEHEKGNHAGINKRR